MNLRRPSAAAVADANQLTTILLGFYDALIELSKPQQPGRSPGLKAITQSTFADMRMQVGDVNGELGPRLALVSGTSSVLDGGEGVFAWEPNSKAADNNVSVLQVSGVDVGRWIRIL